MIVDYTIDEVNIDNFDALAIPGGFEVYHFYNDAYNERFLQLIRDFKLKDKIIASICVGALPVGKSGILKNKKATTYQSEKRQTELSSFGVELVKEPIVITEKVITSWNPSTAAEVAFILLEWLTSKDNANHIRTIMGFKPFGK
jgi:4-methyl-5(b-hydroxyethyl)-thiazole monophosphate biosynthesis